jgi:hypothetical protein
MKGIRQHAELVVAVVTLAIFAETAFFDHHTGARIGPRRPCKPRQRLLQSTEPIKFIAIAESA